MKKKGNMGCWQSTIARLGPRGTDPVTGRTHQNIQTNMIQERGFICTGMLWVSCFLKLTAEKLLTPQHLPTWLYSGGLRTYKSWGIAPLLWSEEQLWKCWHRLETHAPISHLNED